MNAHNVVDVSLLVAFGALVVSLVIALGVALTCFAVMRRLHAAYMACVNDLARVNGFLRFQAVADKKPPAVASTAQKRGEGIPSKKVETVLREGGAEVPGLHIRAGAGM